MRSLILGTCLLLAACGGAGDGSDRAVPPLTAATLGEQAVLSPSDSLKLPQFAGADRERGRRLARACRACHTLEEDGIHMLGPNLYGLFGREVGAVRGFAYSKALAQAEFVWTPRALDAWLAAPTRFLPGNRMSYAGLRNADDRDALIAYLLLETANIGAVVAE